MIKEAQLGLDFNPTDSFVVSIFERNGFILVFKPINYGYKDSKLLREVYVLEKN